MMKPGDVLSRAGRALRGLGGKFAEAYRSLESRHGSLAVAREAAEKFREHQMRLACAYFTYHSFIAIFALVLLASALLGYVLKSNPELQQKLLNSIYDILPDLGNTFDGILETIVKNRNLVSIIGLVGLIWTGSKMSTSLETGFNLIQGTASRPFWKRRLLAMGVILLVVLLGAGFVVLGFIYEDVISWIDEQAGTLWSTASHVTGLLLTLAIEFAVFALLLKAVPQKRPHGGALFKASLLAAVAFHVTRVGFDYYFTNVSKTKLLYGTIGVVIGLLIWLYFIGAVIFYSAEVMEILRRRRI